MPTLTPAQLQTLKTNIAANTSTVLIGGVATAINAIPNTGDGNDAIAGWYNQPAAGPWVVWRDLSMETVLGLVSYANMTPLDAVPTDTALNVAIWQARSLACQGKQFNLQNLTISRNTAPMKRTNYRAALQDCLTGLPAGASGALIAANWTGVRDAAKFSATNAEKLFSTGTGSGASPADLVFEGNITLQDIETARNLP